jgi:hypothetical protein
VGYEKLTAALRKNQARLLSKQLQSPNMPRPSRSRPRDSVALLQGGLFMKCLHLLQLLHPLKIKDSTGDSVANRYRLHP